LDGAAILLPKVISSSFPGFDRGNSSLAGLGDSILAYTRSAARCAILMDQSLTDDAIGGACRPAFRSAGGGGHKFRRKFFPAIGDWHFGAYRLFSILNSEIDTWRSAR
jgi:hypothetical protein